MRKLAGIITPIITPLTTNMDIDEISLKKIIEFLIESKVSGIFPLGSTGEGAALSQKLRQKMLKLTIQIVNKRIPVLAGVSSASMIDSLDFSNYAKEIGCDYIVVSPPCFLPPTDKELVYYYQEFCKLDIPVCIYNMPTLTGCDLTPELMYELGKLPNVTAIKDSSGNFENFKKLLTLLGENRDISIFIGPEALTLDALKLGADGGVNSGSNLRPDLFINLYNAYNNGDFSKIDEMQTKILELQKIYGSPINTQSVIKGLKSNLANKGIIKNIYAPPFLP